MTYIQLCEELKHMNDTLSSLSFDFYRKMSADEQLIVRNMLDSLANRATYLRNTIDSAQADLKSEANLLNYANACHAKLDWVAILPKGTFDHKPFKTPLDTIDATMLIKMVFNVQKEQISDDEGGYDTRYWLDNTTTLHWHLPTIQQKIQERLEINAEHAQTLSTTILQALSTTILDNYYVFLDLDRGVEINQFFTYGTNALCVGDDQDPQTIAAFKQERRQTYPYLR